ncbi:P-selectin glycoprotein ligand 1 isoform X1 [Arvicanthis niloticus]|uniref:P-selectin glycoprotein ligand 1 isoform X1 n=1 Tax=Arvicanthis niloticus TaxID=61156 RepID=UPI0014862B88|nr:P-selectin glycoprotein ligand 1 [Arvicanthis niloticus]
MFLRFLLLLTILGPGNSLPLWDSWGHETKEALSPVHLRERRQVVGDEDFDDPDYMYTTDPPELLKNVTNTVSAHPKLLSTTAMQEQSVPMEAGTSETATVKVATTGPAGPDAGRPAVGMLSTKPATQWSLTTGETTIQPASTEAETSQPASPMAETPQPAPTEAETSQPAPTEAETSKPAPTEAETSKPAPTEAETSKPAPTEAETTQLPRNQALESLFTTSAATEAPSTEPTATETASTASTAFLGLSVTHKDFGHLPDSGLKKGLIVTPGSSPAPAPTPPGTSDLIPVKQCLLVILILASLATIFLVCTVVLAVRLSRKTHTYPVRNYSPTEMICISSLLPEGGDGAPATANGGLSKVQNLKTEPSGDRDGDDLTLHSFLP